MFEVFKSTFDECLAECNRNRKMRGLRPITGTLYAQWFGRPPSESHVARLCRRFLADFEITIPSDDELTAQMNALNKL